MYQASEPGNQQHPPLKGHRSRRVYMHVKLISRKSLVPIQLFGLVGLVGKVGKVGLYINWKYITFSTQTISRSSRKRLDQEKSQVGLDQKKSQVPIQLFLLDREIVCVLNVIYFQLISESNLRQRIFFEGGGVANTCVCFFASTPQPIFNLRNQYLIICRWS